MNVNISSNIFLKGVIAIESGLIYIFFIGYHQNEMIEINNTTYYVTTYLFSQGPYTSRLKHTFTYSFQFENVY